MSTTATNTEVEQSILDKRAEQNKIIASMLDDLSLFDDDSTLIKVNSEGIFQLQKDDPNYKRWLEE